MASMTPEQAKAQALARFKEHGAEHINCGQAVLVYALYRLDEDPDLVTHAGYFGGGVAGLGEICGALNGSALALGVRDMVLKEKGQEPPAATKDELRAILRDFEQKFGARTCLALTGHDLSTPEGLTAFHMSDVYGKCAEYVEWAIDRVEPLLAPALD
jgi:C_GCAxxG_C_C family probable redox protein